jgi:4-amino-4-deoxy-L-arabinose transferase-like glycosyltransferase
MLARASAVAILAILLAKLALLAAVYPRRPQAFTYIDSRSYVGPALALLEHGHFSPTPERVPEPEINRTPGYPLLIATLYAVFGPKPWVLSAAGACFCAGTAFALFALARRLVDERAAFCAVLLFSLDFGTFWRSLDVLSDSSFTCLLTVGLLLAVASVQSSSAAAALLAGLALASATLARPISLYLLPLFSLVFLAGRPRRTALLRAGAFAIPCLLLVGGWAIRNFSRAGTFTVTPLPSSQLLFFFASGVQADVDGVTISVEQVRLGDQERHYRSGGGSEAEAFGTRRYEELFPQTARISYEELCSLWRAQALRILAAHPVLTIKKLALYIGTLLLTPPVVIFGFQYGLYWPAPSLSDLFHDLNAQVFLATLAQTHPVVFAFSVACIFQLIAVYGLAVAGLAARRARDGHVLAVATLIYLVFVSAGTQACDDRFRLPIVPLAALYAGLPLSRLIGRRRTASL